MSGTKQIALGLAVAAGLSALVSDKSKIRNDLRLTAPLSEPIFGFDTSSRTASAFGAFRNTWTTGDKENENLKDAVIQTGKRSSQEPMRKEDAAVFLALVGIFLFYAKKQVKV